MIQVLTMANEDVARAALLEVKKQENANSVSGIAGGGVFHANQDGLYDTATLTLLVGRRHLVINHVSRKGDLLSKNSLVKVGNIALTHLPA
ncbi:hypothetical protein [Streptomyces chartreusis]|uniref:hypothetical protein n=1 Tax=Streptomyces chartreusis TaxID=1969 RepID=UPI0036B53F37